MNKMELGNKFEGNYYGPSLDYLFKIAFKRTAAAKKEEEKEPERNVSHNYSF